MGSILNTLANLGIVTGYLMVPFLWLPLLPLTLAVKLSGTVFFLTCAITHLAMAFHWNHFSGWLLANHVIQAFAVLLFVTGFARLLRDAHLRQQAEDEEAL